MPWWKEPKCTTCIFDRNLVLAEFENSSSHDDWLTGSARWGGKDRKDLSRCQLMRCRQNLTRADSLLLVLALSFLFSKWSPIPIIRPLSKIVLCMSMLQLLLSPKDIQCNGSSISVKRINTNDHDDVFWNNKPVKWRLPKNMNIFNAEIWMLTRVVGLINWTNDTYIR